MAKPRHIPADNDQAKPSLAVVRGMVGGLLSELKSEQDGLNQLIEQLVGDLDASRTRLKETEQQLEAERHKFVTQRDDWARRCEELEKLQPNSQDELQQQASEWQRQRISLETELDISRKQTEVLRQERSGWQTQLQTAQRQIELMQQERAALIDELHHLQETAKAPDHERGELAEKLAGLGREADALKQQASDWRQERLALESELETVRCRAADLAQTVSEQKRQMAEERADWTGELKHLRQILEKQTEALTQRIQATTQSPAAAPAESNDGQTRETRADPVLGSVMAQFEMLQQDVQRRRSAGRAAS